jgi:hypothetical protein
MKISVTFWVIAVVALFQMNMYGVHGAISIDNTVICSDIEVVQEYDFIVLLEVCARGSYSSPSPAQDESGTITYIGGYQNIYTIVEGPAPGEDEEVGIEIIVGRDDNDVCSGISVIITSTNTGASADSCVSCTYCGNDSYSFDCSNVRYGRVVSNNTCESAIPGIDVFFPLNDEVFVVNHVVEPGPTPPIPALIVPSPPISAPTSATTTLQKIIRFFTGVAERILN